MGSIWQPESAVVERLCSLVRAGSSVRAAASALELPLSVAYRLAHQHQIHLQQKRKTHSAEYAEVKRLWLQGLAPMDIVRASSVGSSVVYRIGIELGLWRRNPHGRRAAATTRRCGYLILRANAVNRRDAATACGIDRRDALDIDKGLIKVRNIRVPFVPDGPDTALYNRLMQVIPYVDGRQAVPVHIIPQERINRRISSRYLSIEEREMIFDL